MLHGLRPADWRRVRQVSMEVHDIYGRLGAAVALLRRHGFRVATEAQLGGTEEGYEMVVPCASMRRPLPLPPLPPLPSLPPLPPLLPLPPWQCHSAAARCPR